MPLELVFADEERPAAADPGIASEQTLVEVSARKPRNPGPPPPPWPPRPPRPPRPPKQPKGSGTIPDTDTAPSTPPSSGGPPGALDNTPLMKDRVSTGRAAVATLRSDPNAAERIAARVNKTLPQLEQELEQDPSLALDEEEGQLFYVCSSAVIEPAEISSASLGASAAEPPAEDVFALHSRPGASKIIYLDFDGQETTGSAWRPTGTIISPPYDIDGDFSTFSNTEKANMM